MKKTIVSFILTLVLFVTLGAITAFAEDADFTTAEYTYTHSDGTQTVGLVVTAYNGSDMDIYIPSKIAGVPVLKIGDNFLAGNTTVNSVTLGAGIKEIGAGAFSGATNMVCALLNEDIEVIGENAFSNMPVFNSIILWDSVKAIGDGAFENCPNLTIYCNEGTAVYTFVTSNGIDYEILNPEAEPEIYTVDGVTYYIMNGEANAVSFDNSVLDLVIPATVEGYPLTDIRMAFMESKLVSVELPASLRKIADQAFHACYDLTSVYIPEGVENIGILSFARCISLKDVELPHSVYEIGGGAFGLCLGLEKVVINSNISQISNEMFYGCECLEIVELPESVVSIGANAFQNCSSLANITFPQGLVEINERAFMRCSGLTEIALPNSVQMIGNEAFSGCSNVTTLVLSSQLKNIPYGAFASLGISRLDLPSGIEEIGKNAFFGCQHLKYVYLPEGLTSIGEYAFCNCLILASVIVPDTVTFLGNVAFSSTAILFVEENSYAHTVAVERNYTYHLLSEDQAPKTYYDQGVTYMIIDDQAIVAYFDDTYDEIVIPETVLDCPVVDIGVAFSESTIKSITLPGNLSSIGFFAFRGCRDLETVIILDGVTEIGKEAFAKCVSLKKLSLPETLVRIVAYAFDECCNLENVVIPKSVRQIESYAFNNCKGLKTIVLSEKMTKIYDGLFYGCSGMESITLLDSITEIGDYSFSGCSSLKSINIPDGITQLSIGVFNECEGLQNIEIPKSVTKIGGRAFRRCAGLKSINIPDTVTTIERGAFASCTGLENINIPQNITTICEGVFSGCIGLKSITIPDQVVEIGNTAFYGCSNLESITIPEKVMKIGYNAFSFCSELKSVVIPKNVIQMGSEVFYDCYNLESVIIEEGLIKLEDRTFMECSNLKYVVLPNSISSVGSGVFPDKVICCVLKDSYMHTYAESENLLYYIIDEKQVPEFYYVDGVEYCVFNDEAVALRFDNSVCNVLVPNEIYGVDVVSIGNAFKNSLIESVVIPETIFEIEDKAFYGCSKLKDIIIPESVTKIGTGAFERCASLKSINIPDTVTIIETRAFALCTGLENINISQNITTICEGVFFGCIGLESITIPENVTSIGYEAFAECNSLQSIVIPENVRSIDGGAFRGCSNLENITIPISVKQIGDSAFKQCSKLTSINLPKNITEIGNSTFEGCNLLERIIIPESVTRIGNKAFWECRNLNTVTILGSPTEIEKYAFVYCDKLSYIVLPNSVISLNEYSFHKTVLGVYENSYAHNFAVENDLLYFVIRETPNPEISYGTSITGVVSYTDGSTASGVTVDLLYDDGEVKETVITDANGEYSFTYAEVGRYTIRVNDGINTASEQVSVKRKNVFDVILTGETDLVLKKGYTVSGNVSGEGSITVTITDKDGNVIDSVVTENGSFEFENISGGEYIIKTENADGSVTVEVTVFGGDVALENITIEKAEVYVTLFGKVVVEDRENEEHAREWAQVTVYNSDGVVVATAKTDANGEYSFANLPVGEYTIKAEVTEMREDEYYGYIRPHILKGYAYVDTFEAGEYEVETIVLTEEESQRVSVAGKVTAQGEHQECEVILMNENRDEIARFKTKKNGKYQFDNVRDGYYILCAVTGHDGAGFAEITVKNGVVYGETDIRVYKSDRVSAHEAIMLEVPDCDTIEQAEQYRETVMSEKTFYDSVPNKEKKMFSAWYIEKLDKLVQLLSGYEFTSDGAEVTNGGLIVSEEEVSSGANPHFTISVVEMDKWEKNKNGIETDEDYYQTFVEEAAGDNELAQYYDITLECEKNGKTYEIKDVKKHTDTTGKIRLTMPIPDKFKGHKNYAFVHVHNGVPTTLVDLDDDPDTITFEIDKFSTFALMFNDEEQADLSDYATLSVADGVLSATSTLDATLFVATYDADGRMSDVKLTTLYADTPVEINVEAGQKAFVLDSTMSPLCEEVIVG